MKCPLPYDAIGAVTLLEADRISIRRTLDAEEPVFRGHYPHQPIFPGVFILEAVVQAVRRFAGAASAGARLETVQSLRFQSPLGPGDTFELACECGAPDAEGIFPVKARCTSAGKPVAEAKARFLWAPHA